MWQQNSQNCWPYPLPSYHSQVWREFFIKHCMLSAPRPQSSHDPWLSSQCLYTQWSGSLVCSQNPQPYVTLHMPDMPDGFSKTRLLTLQYICAFCVSGFPALKILSLPFVSLDSLHLKYCLSFPSILLSLSDSSPQLETFYQLLKHLFVFFYAKQGVLMRSFWSGCWEVSIKKKIFFFALLVSCCHCNKLL